MENATTYTLTETEIKEIGKELNSLIYSENESNHWEACHLEASKVCLEVDIELQVTDLVADYGDDGNEPYFGCDKNVYFTDAKIFDSESNQFEITPEQLELIKKEL